MMNTLPARLDKFRVGAFVGASTALWGLWLLNPWVTSFARFPSLAHMARMATEEAWGTYFALAGLTLLLGIAADQKLLHYLGALAVFAGRSFLLIFVGLQTGWAANGVPDYAVWASMALLCLLRVYRHGRV